MIKNIFWFCFYIIRKISSFINGGVLSSSSGEKTLGRLHASLSSRIERLTFQAGFMGERKPPRKNQHLWKFLSFLASATFVRHRQRGIGRSRKIMGKHLFQARVKKELLLPYVSSHLFLSTLGHSLVWWYFTAPMTLNWFPDFFGFLICWVAHDMCTNCPKVWEEVFLICQPWRDVLKNRPFLIAKCYLH